MKESEFKNLYDKYFDSIRRYIYYRSSDEALATDVAQNCFLKLWEKKDFLYKKNIKALLYKMATDEFINHWRKQKREREFANEHFEIKSNEAENENEEIIKYRKKMQLILSGLGERQRSVFLMNKMDGLTISEIANYLGLSIKAVEKRMTQAWKFIKLEADKK